MNQQRIETANRVLSLFAADTRLEIVGGHAVVCWKQCGKPIRRRWMTRGQDFYPVWHKLWGYGGTATTVLSQLVRWIKDKPVLPLTTWEWWGSRICYLFRDKAEEVIAALREGGYPENAVCVLCERNIIGGMDWWSLKGVSGPCCFSCSMNSGCQQELPPPKKSAK